MSSSMTCMHFSNSAHKFTMNSFTPEKKKKTLTKEDKFAIPMPFLGKMKACTGRSKIVFLEPVM